MLQKIIESDSAVSYPRVFWQPSFSSSYRIAWGHVARARALPTLHESTWFGCFGFEPGNGWFFEPQQVAEEKSNAFPLQSHHPLPRIVERSDAPSFALWKKNVDLALDRIHKGYLDKIVLARRTTLKLASSVCPWDILVKLRKQHHPSTTLFFVQRSPVTAFIGATPEKLYERKGAHLRTMALAGTRRRKGQPDEDLILRQELLSSEKERREVAFVNSDLYHTLQKLCHTMTGSAQPTILETRHLYHLLYSLQGELHSDISDRYLLQVLHPTAALGGTPRAAALRLIKTLEPFKRGWYGAPLGWFSKDEADVAIGIRSAMIQGNQVHLYGGAGIVNGSTAENEWDELESKIAGFLHLWENS